MIVLLSSAGLCKSVSQKTDTSDMGIYISSVTNDITSSTSNKITPPMVDSDPWVVDDVMTDDGDGEESGIDNDVNDIDINDDNNWW
jgi:hypothetical protein